MKFFNTFDFYNFYNILIIKLIRFLVLFLTPFLLLITLNDYLVFQIILITYTLFLINEIFILFKLNIAFPQEKVFKNSGKIENSILFKTRKQILFKRTGDDIFMQLYNSNDSKFLLLKVGNEYVFQKQGISKQALLEKALEITKKVNGEYITSADIVTSYLLLSEEKTKYLFNSEITENDLLEILIWTRQKYNNDIKKKFSINFTGYGVFDFFVYGWETLVKECSFDITYSVINSNSNLIVGRESEFKRMVSVLAKNNSNNILLIGEPGVGKVSLVKKLAYEAYVNPTFILSHKKVYELLVDRLLSGVNSSGELNERLNLLLSELEHSGNIILLIQNLENIFGGGGLSLDISGVIFEYLKSGRVQIIGTTTPSSYKQLLEKKTSVMNMFEKINVEEPNRIDTFKMISSHVNEIENEYGISISYKAIHECIELSSSYMLDKVLPGKAINLLSDAASSLHLEGRSLLGKNDIIKLLQEKTKIVLEKPTDTEKKTLLSLENELHKRVIGQNEAIDAVAKSIRRLRSGFSQHNRPISVFLFLGPTGVGKTETAKALASVYFGDENSMIRLDMSEYQTQNEVDKLLGGFPGGEVMENSLPDAVRMHPFSLLLLDEFEKASPHILDIFLQIFEDGRMTDNQGKLVSFKNTIIIATSNAGSEEIREMINSNMLPFEMKNKLVEILLAGGIFKPELMNRFDDVIIFKPLNTGEAKDIAKLLLSHSLKSLEDEQIYLSFDDKLIDKIVNESFDIEAGARNIRRYIGSTIEDFISKLILEDKLKRGDKLILSVDERGELILK